MKNYNIFGIFIFLMKKRKTTAKEIGKEFEISQRSVYRYIDDLSILGVPIVTKLGKGGGIEILGEYCIENIALSHEEKNILKEYMLRKDIPESVLKILNKLV